MKAIIVADGEVNPSSLRHAAFSGQTMDEPELVVAADGGALKAELLGLRPDVVVGDLDSLSPADVERLSRAGAEIVRHPEAKDESDTELALLEAVRRGAGQLVVLGALGGSRIDHALANLLLLGLPQLAGLQVTLLHDTSVVRLLSSAGPAASLVLAGRPGELISLLPLSEVVEGVRTTGLLYPLAGEPLAQGPSRGLSNVLQSERATVEISAGRLVVIQTAHQSMEAHDG